MSQKENIDPLEVNLSRLRYEIERTFPGTEFAFNRKEAEREARIYLNNNYKKSIEVDLSNLNSALAEAIWTVKEILNCLDS